MRYALSTIAWLILGATAACGPNTSIPASDSSIQGSVNGTGISTSTTNTGSGTTSGGVSGGTGQVSVNGTVGTSSFTAQDAVFAVNPSPQNLDVMTVVIADQPNLCNLLATHTGAANLVIMYLSSVNPNTYPSTGTYPVVDPNGSVPSDVSDDGAFSQVAFAAVGVASGVFANNGQVTITTAATTTTSPESMTITATDANQESVAGTLTPAYCSALVSSNTTSNVVRTLRPRNPAAASQ